MFSLEKIDLVHCCLERGVRLRVFFSDKITFESFHQFHMNNGKLISDLYIHSLQEKGFFRFNFCGTASISGVFQESAVTVLYTLLSSGKILKNLESIFPGFEEEFLEARRNI